MGPEQSPDLTAGVVVSITNRHRLILNRIEQLSSTIARGDQDPTVVVRLIEQLMRYISMQFEVEERLMHCYAYLYLPQHHAEHAEILQHVLDLQESGDTEVLENTLSVLSHQLEAHTQDTDIGMCLFLSTKSCVHTRSEYRV